MKERDTIRELSMLGGPLYRMGDRLGLVRKVTNTVRMGVALGLSSWSVLMILALLGGFGPEMSSLASIGVHVRLLVVIPLFFVCESLVLPEMSRFADDIVRTGLVSAQSLPTLVMDIRCVGRMKDSWLAEGLFLLVAITLPIVEMISDMPHGTGSWASMLQAAGGHPTWMHGWYLGFCLPLFRFLLIRWLWRLGLWWYFLWRVEKLDLHLIPTHSDGSGGLGYLEIVHEQFAPFAMAISANLAAQFAEEISSGTMSFETLYRFAPGVMLLAAIFFLAPLTIFSGKLWHCRVTGMREYMGLATQYAKAFDRKWLRGENPSGESLLGTSDLQSLADLTNSIEVVRGMRTFPASRRLLTVLGTAVVVPLLPLIFLKFPVDQVAARLLQLLTGL